MPGSAVPCPNLFLSGGGLRDDLLTPAAAVAMREALRLTRSTRWDSVRSPHLFMGLLSAPDVGVRLWGEKLRADLARLLVQFQELFMQDQGEADSYVALNREFLSDNVIRLLREAMSRAVQHKRSRITTLDVLVCLLSSPNSIVAEYFDRIGLASSRLADLAVLAEQDVSDAGSSTERLT